MSDQLSDLGLYSSQIQSERNSDVSEPGRMFLSLAAYTVEKHGLQSGGNGTALAATDGAIVKLANRRNLRCSAREKSLVSTIDLVTRDALLDYRNADLSRELYDGCTGNPFQAGRHVR